MKRDRVDVCIIVAHPDDEVLWAGGTIMLHPEWNCFIISLCRANDPDRSPKFFKVVDYLNASGRMTDLDDGPKQNPLKDKQVQEAILKIVGNKKFDFILSHGPNGEYTRHLRHEETSRAVMDLWAQNKIRSDELWLFAYEDGSKAYLPRANKNAHKKIQLPKEIREEKRMIISKIYGFTPNSWEVKTTPEIEAFWSFKSITELNEWRNESFSTI